VHQTSNGINELLSTMSNYVGHQPQTVTDASGKVTQFTYSTPACGNQVSGSYTFEFPAILNLSSLTVTAQSCFPA